MFLSGLPKFHSHISTLPLSMVKSSWNALTVTHSMTRPRIVTRALRILPTVTYNRNIPVLVNVNFN